MTRLKLHQLDNPGLVEFDGLASLGLDELCPAMEASGWTQLVVQDRNLGHRGAPAPHRHRSPWLLDPDDPEMAVGLNVVAGEDTELVVDHVVGSSSASTRGRRGREATTSCAPLA